MIVRTFFIIGSILAGFALGSTETFASGILSGLFMGTLALALIRFERLAFHNRASETLVVSLALPSGSA